MHELTMASTATNPQLHLFADVPKRAASFTGFCNALGVDLDGPWADRFGNALRHWAARSIRTPIRTLSLFSGAGGLDIAFHDAGFEIGTMVEIEERFVATLRANCGESRYLSGARAACCDIREYHPEPNLQIDFIIGGPPCQSFSAAGRRAAGVQGTEDSRGSLFSEYVRILKQLRPRGFLFENVYGITGAQKGRAWQDIREAFEGAGYHVFHRILDAADYGVPQHRERMFIVGTTGNKYLFPCPTHGPDSPEGLPHVTASLATEGAPVSKAELEAVVKGRFGHLLNEIPPGLNYSFFTEQMGHPSPIFAWRSKFSDFLYKADPNAPIRTLKAQGGQYTGPFHWDNRPFSIGELKRLQTFPDAYELVGRRQIAIHQIGNSVPPQVARMLASSILAQLFEADLPAELPLLEQSESLGFRQRKRGLTAVYRAKAQAAIDVLDEKKCPKAAEGRDYQAALGDDFEWREAPRLGASLQVQFTANESSWIFDVAPLAISDGARFLVEVSAVSGAKWGLNVRKVLLRGGALTREVFTGAWKAFEAELVRHRVKADLVQLCGYYQYKPILRCNMELLADCEVSWQRRALKRVVEGRGVGAIMREEELAREWGISGHDVLGFAHWLRGLGYEVRNRHTNPQIPKKCLLVPYVFPTLNPLSVQLRKSLFGASDGREG